MKFIHAADVHLGASPDAGSSYTENRGGELWESFERLLAVCEEEKADLLLLAGDLFHRQPLLRELKEIDYLFSGLSVTKVVLIAGNHDYIKPGSYYRTFQWSSNVYPLFTESLDAVELKEIGVCVYGLSYYQREISERLYDYAFPQRRQPIEILLAHGGDDKHIPINRNKLIDLGYDYIALGHIHKPAEVEKNRIYYSGSLEPTDKNDTGRHGFIRGEIVNGATRAEFVPFAGREYIHMEVEVDAKMTSRAVKEKVGRLIEGKGTENIFKITLTGFREPDMLYDTESMDIYGNILEIVDETEPAYDFDKLQRQNSENLLGKYIESLRESEKGSVEHEALFEGVKALLETKRG